MKNTELVLLASSSEEAGLRGAKRFVARHLEGMRRIPTRALIIDNVYDERHLTLVSSELFTGARPDLRLAGFAKEVASERGWKLDSVPIAIGATDASAFTQAGIPAISLLLSETRTLPMQYHTRYDTPDRVRPESLEVALLMVAGILERVDAA